MGNRSRKEEIIRALVDGPDMQEYLLQLADDELILGHRDSEWCGLAPIIEEDIAFANLALDEISHASLWYGLLAQMRGENPATYPDWLVFFRGAEGYRNIQMVELPNNDWAFSILRQFLFDAYERLHLNLLTESRFSPLAEIASKIVKEEIYHYRHSSAWVRRLGKGTQESYRRMQGALDTLWPYALQLFHPSPGRAILNEVELLPDLKSLQSAWEEDIIPIFEECSLMIPARKQMSYSRNVHTSNLETLLAEMQSVARQEAGAIW